MGGGAVVGSIWAVTWHLSEGGKGVAAVSLGNGEVNEVTPAWPKRGK